MPDANVDMLRRAGYTEGETGKIVVNVTRNLFTNDFNDVVPQSVMTFDSPRPGPSNRPG